MNYQEAVEFVKENQHRIVSFHRSWNNSMYIYDDSVQVWNGKGLDRIYLGTDFFDSFSFKVDKNTEAYKAFKAMCKHNREVSRRRELKECAMQYAHHGKLTAWRIALFLKSRTIGEVEAYHRLLKTKNFRSKFRSSCCTQLLSFIKTPRKKRKFPTPLSPKQMQYL